MQSATRRSVPEIRCCGTGVVSHTGTVLLAEVAELAELADRIGLTALLSEATGGLRERRAGLYPGRVLVDVRSRSRTEPSPTFRPWPTPRARTGRPGTWRRHR